MTGLKISQPLAKILAHMGTPPPAAYIAYPGLNQQQIETLTVLGDRWDSVKKLQQDLG